MIDGVVIKKLVKHCDDRGYFVEIVRDDDKLLKKFGQSSFTITYPGVIKAFHYHKKQDDLWFVATGNAQVVLHDLRKKSKTHGETQVIYAGENDPCVILIPVGVAHGYKVLGNKPVGLFYHVTESYNAKKPDELRIPWDDKKINFDWETKFR
ncbi:dTDP-4-dehydrorhamnose 3,5-epimerase family protein [Candidatus Woesearchaeota archaeon]|nr:dTDP-4-dehydrorhamnose 3,5-epimerase family protein [Candidatus Woesearchaeota archaeon]